MKKIPILLLLICSLFFGCKTKQIQEKTELVLKNETDTISYIIGADVAKNLSANEIEINKDLFIKGFVDHHNGIDTIFTQEEKQMIVMDLQRKLQMKQKEKMDKEKTENIAKGKIFLEENRKKEGVFVTASGLQFKVITETQGKKPTKTSTITVHYEGKLLDGTVFDSSYDRGEPVVFNMEQQFIPGWTEGLKLMSEKSVYEFFIPSELGYGDRPIPGIPPGSVLIFKVELISVE